VPHTPALASTMPGVINRYKRTMFISGILNPLKSDAFALRSWLSHEKYLPLRKLSINTFQ
jgi:hypothetical protein